MSDKKQIHLGLSMRQVGYHTASWRHPTTPADGAMDINYFVHVAHVAEKGLFDLLFLADALAIHQDDLPAGSLSRLSRNVELEPFTLLSALAMVTKHVGLVATGSTTYNEPFNLARKLASLDHISGGRAGWNMVTSWSQKEAQNFNRDQHVEYDTRYERGAEFMQVAKGLWKSWDEGAFIRNKETGQFYDESKRHALNHKGKHFSVAGPLTVDRCPQGRPVIVQAGKSDQGQEIAAETADVVFTVDSRIEDAIAFYHSVKSRMAKYGRDESELVIMPGLLPVLGRTEAEARAKFDAIQALTDPSAGLNLLYNILGDLSGYPLDGPVPEPTDPTLKSRAEVLMKMARRENMTIRQLYLAFASGRGHHVFIGTPDQLADTMEEWIDRRAADGFNITPCYQPAGVEEFVEMAIPVLQKRARFRTRYEGRTLRENLGLPAAN
jgi:alkanesulfonate monooxygenase